MSGFIRKSSEDVQSNSNIVSSGILTLDEIMVMGYGSINCIYEDEDSLIHNTILQIFISKCILNQTQIYAISMDPQNLMSFEVVRNKQEVNEQIKNLLIAWRYQALKTDNNWSPFTLRAKEALDAERIITDFQSLMDLLKNKKQCSIVVFSLYSPLFREYNYSENGQEDKLTLEKALYQIRKYVKINNHCVYMSMPNYMINEPISQYFDNIISISSNLTLPHESPKYNCFIEFLKLTTVNSLRINNLGSYKYGLILKSRKIIIEKIDIPPDENETNESSCGQTF